MTRPAIGDTLSRAFSTAFGNFGVFLRTYGVFLAAVALVGLLAELSLAPFVGGLEALTEEEVTAAPTRLIALLLPLVGVSLLVGLAQFVLGTLALGVGLVVARAVLDGEQPTLGDAWARVAPHALRLVLLALAMVLIALGILLAGGLLAILILPLLAAVVVLVWLVVAWFLAPPLVVFEDARVGAALKRSVKLVRGAWWRVFAVFFVISIAFVVVSVVVTTPGALAMGVDPFAEEPEFSVGASVIASLLDLVVTLVFSPVFATATVLLYRTLSARPAGDVPPPDPGAAGEPPVAP